MRIKEPLMRSLEHSVVGPFVFGLMMLPMIIPAVALQFFGVHWSISWIVGWVFMVVWNWFLEYF